jgi:ABC-type multidrug transport system permease subunit
MYSDKETSEALIEMLEKADENLPKKELVSISGSGKEALTKEQTNMKTNIGYSFVFLTLAYIFCGIFVAYNAITEQKNGVMVRVDLSGTSQASYFIAKFITVLVTTVLVTAFAILYSFIMGVDDFGMERVKFYSLVFLMGLIFGSISMLIGILAGDVMSSTIAAFTIWCMSSLLSGMYFPIKYTTVGLKILSSIMPQKWFIDAVEMIFVKDNNVFVMIICVTVAYILAILSIGALGLKMKRTEEWGTN